MSVTPQPQCSPVWPSLWEFTAFGGNGSTCVTHLQLVFIHTKSSPTIKIVLFLINKVTYEKDVYVW